MIKFKDELIDDKDPQFFKEKCNPLPNNNNNKNTFKNLFASGL